MCTTVRSSGPRSVMTTTDSRASGDALRILCARVGPPKRDKKCGECSFPMSETNNKKLPLLCRFRSVASFFGAEFLKRTSSEYLAIWHCCGASS